MYARILVPLEHSDYDDAILAHIGELARMHKSTVVLIHVADGWAARNQQGLALRESAEMRDDRDYIEARCKELEARGIQAECVLAGGDPGPEIAAAAEREGCDLVAMSTHGHRLLADIFLGTTASRVQHRISVPVLLLRAK